jgi:uncharacterized protein (TIGR00369 family)
VSTEESHPHEARFATLGLQPVSAGDGRSHSIWKPTPFAANSRGHVHGGLLGAIIDDCCAMAVHSAVDEPISTPTVSMHIDYLRPVFLAKEYVCRGYVVRLGGRLAVADTLVEDSEGELCVRGTGTFVIMRMGG